MASSYDADETPKIAAITGYHRTRLVRVHKGVFFSGVARAEDMSAMGDGRIARNGSDNLDGNRQTSS